MVLVDHYDILIVGAGVAGSALAHALSTITSKLRGSPIRVALLERSLSEPDRIVGEVLRPAGIAALQKLGMEGALEGIDSMPELGFCFSKSGRLVHIPYPDGIQGRCFRHGRFIMRLRDYAKRAEGVAVIEATVNELIECQRTGRVLGVRATRSSSGGAKESFLADLVIMADGGRSNFRNAVLGKSVRQTWTPNYTFGVVLKDAQIPMPQHANVVVVEGRGAAVGIMQTSTHHTRVIININCPLPSDIKEFVLSDVVPHMPPSLHTAMWEELNNGRLRRMPNSIMPSVVQGGKYTKEGIILLGDSWNMRHPSAGGGMTVALNDVVLLANMLGSVENFGNWDQISDVLTRWYWARKPMATALSLVSIVLDTLACADDESMTLLLDATLGYMEYGGECALGVMYVVAGVAYSPSFLFYHVYKIVIYAIWFMFAQPQPVTTSNGGTRFSAPSMWQYPSLLIKVVKMLWTVCIVFVPVVWSEIRWW